MSADRYRIEHGDSLALLRREPPNSWDAMVTDPPGGISFMSRAWDGDKGGRKKWVRFMAQRFKAALRVLKPGAHALVWALPRTSHWTGCALEDAGFEVRDGLSHAFGSGFPKSHNLPGGLGTALKPSHELWFLVRKPLEKGLTVAQNHAKWGTGILNIDACRVGISKDVPASPRQARHGEIYGRIGSDAGCSGQDADVGRWPPNLLLTHDARCVCVGTRAVRANPTWDTPNRECESSFVAGNPDSVSGVVHGKNGAEDVPVWECVEGCPVLLLDRQSGALASGGVAVKRSDGRSVAMGKDCRPLGEEMLNYHDSGTASRFFPQFQWDPGLDDLEPFYYAAKASRSERDKGLEHFKGAAAQRDTPNPGGIDAGSRNVHPTVKSVELIRYFVRLVTPRGSEGRPKVGDIFTGSGTGGVAALLEGCDFVGFELNDTDEEPFVSIARARCEHVVGGSYVPRAALRVPEPLKQRSLFEVMQ
jgi:hypothetical protein